MRKSQVKPRNEESTFDIHEMFFSRTDLRGVIETGNSVFSRVSGYPLDEMVGKPHSIIRHPDIPRAVFKLFWETVERGEPMIAYVKNLAADGRYYWVLASAFPVENGYISIRFKPTTAFRDKVAGLYAEVMKVEQAKGMDEAYAFLVQQVLALGVPSYRKLAEIFLVSELESREALMAQSPTSHVSFADVVPNNANERAFLDLIQRSDAVSRDAVKRYKEIFARIKVLDECKVGLESASQRILASYQTVKHLPLNMAVESERVGDEGRTLAVISQTFRKWATEVNDALKSFFEATTVVAEQSGLSNFNVVTSRLQVEMINFLVIENRGKWDAPDFDARHTMTEFVPFIEMAVKGMQTAHDALLPLLEKTKSLDKEILRLNEAISALYIIRQSGRVEAERLHSDNGGFHAHLDNMAHFLNLVRGELKTVRETERKLLATLTDLESAIGDLRSDFASLVTSRNHRISA